MKSALAQEMEFVISQAEALVDPGAMMGARTRVPGLTTGRVASLPENSITTRHILFEELFCP